MSTPYEELENLAEFLPEEGESLIVSRRGGELVCQPLNPEEGSREGIADGELYGRLVLANERLGALAAVPVWTCMGIAFAACVAFHKLTGIGWEGWYVDVAVAFLAAMSFTVWATIRRRRLYAAEIRPMLDSQLRARGLNRFAIVGALRQHPELRCLLDELSRASG
jgi:hypothetical protein